MTQSPEEVARKLSPDAQYVLRAMAAGDSPYSVNLRTSDVSRSLQQLRRAGFVTPIDAKVRGVTPSGLRVAALLKEE